MTRMISRGVLMIVAVVVAVSATGLAAADPLPSWQDGATKTAIMEFVAKVTKEGGPDFVPPAERIATFDNDGTLWAEQPMYFQFLFALDRVKALAPQHPEWKDKEPFASVLKGKALAGGEKAVGQMLAATHAGMTTTEFERIVKDWLAAVLPLRPPHGCPAGMGLRPAVQHRSARQGTRRGTGQGVDGRGHEA